MHQDLLTIEEVTKQDLYEIIKLAAVYKRSRGTMKEKPLDGKSIGMIFAKSSTRTRVSFEVGIRELGGFSIFLEESKLQVGRGETIPDTARVLSRYLHAVIIRTYKHEEVVEFAKYAHIPVINALTDEYHPCQTLADIFTIYEFSEKLEGIKIAYLGDGQSNMANSLILGAKLAGMELTICAPEEFKPRQDLMGKSLGTGSAVWEIDPKKAVAQADYIYTDVWVSMGFEEEAKKRVKMLTPYQVNMELLSAAGPETRILHCLPAHRGEEITDDVLESKRSIVFDEAENRLHVQKAILALMLGEKN
ncbi:MAG: ornithine carbamoyltransferase [Lentisphaerae bacterium GWF2_44_16]|nr:MAG: ornithine carbamoyltransferase [Lentisphaerae bacterium GWF2_44_16]